MMIGVGSFFFVAFEIYGEKMPCKQVDRAHQEEDSMSDKLNEIQNRYHKVCRLQESIISFYVLVFHIFIFICSLRNIYVGKYYILW
jgi:hypothetical protein